MALEIIKTCEQIHTETLERVKSDMGKLMDNCKHPNICIVQVGNNPASDIYVRGKLNDLDYVGIPWELRKLSVHTSADALARELTDITSSNKYTGMIVQLPLPVEIANTLKDSHAKVADFISRYADIDGFRDDSLYTPCTPLGIMMFLAENNINLDGKVVTIINRSDIVGKPLAKMMQDCNATVMVAHSHTPVEFLRDVMIPQSDIIVTAVGLPYFINHYSTFMEDTLIIDVGINRGDDGKLCGDCEKGLWIDGGYITPVPKGVGLLTRAAFVNNCFESRNK